MAKRKAPPVTTGYDPRAIERAPKFADGHLSKDEDPRAEDADAHLDIKNNTASSPKAPDGISGDWQ